MTKIEKIVLSFIVVLVLFSCYIAISVANRVNEAGGLRNVIVDTGKEIKGIINDISENEN